MSEAALQKVLAARVRRARRELPGVNGRPLSQQAFADRLGVHVVTVSQWETGSSSPNVENLAAIARETGKPFSFFLGEGDDDEEDDRVLRAIVTELVARGQDDLASALLERVRIMKARREVEATRELAELVA